MKELFEEIKNKLLHSGLAKEQEVIGCSKQEIDAIEKMAGCKLPTAYLWFLKYMGRGAGTFLVGSDFYYPKILELRASAAELLDSLGTGFRLPSTSFVFLVHQGYQFLFFAVNAPDPEVFLFVDSEPQPRRIGSSFTHWLDGCINDEAAISKDTEQRLAKMRRGSVF